MVEEGRKPEINYSTVCSSSMQYTASRNVIGVCIELLLQSNPSS